MNAATVYAFEDATRLHSFRVSPGEWVRTNFGPAQVVHVTEGQWRFSLKPKLKLTVLVPVSDEAPAFETVVLLHPDLPERWPDVLVPDDSHDFDPIYEGCRRCGALPGEGVFCDPPVAARQYGGPA